MTLKQTLDAQGLGNFVPPFDSYKTQFEVSPTVKQKDSSFHYMPYDFNQSRFELEILKNTLQLADFKTKGLEKVANFDAEVVNKAKHYVLIDSYGFHNLIGPEFNKYAQLGHNIVNLPKNDALWTLVHLGASEEDITKVAGSCKSSEVEVENELKAPKSKDKVTNDSKEKIKGLKESETKEVTETVKKAEALTDKLIKAAAVLPEMVTVDAVLSLGLMKSFNVAEYIQLIPDYERVIGELCKLLITVRLGMKQIPEASVRNAVEALTEVLYSLKQLSMVLQNQTKK